jgi:hypothetical protein
MRGPVIVQPSKLRDGWWFWVSDAGTNGHTQTEHEAQHLAKETR